MTSIGAEMTGWVMPSRSVSRVEIAICPPRSTGRQEALARHQLVGALPARQCANALGPGVDVGVALGPVVAMLLDRVEDITCQGEIGDGGPVADHELRARQVLVDDGSGSIEA